MNHLKLSATGKVADNITIHKMKAKSIYVAATSQHVGKTTSTLGLVALMRSLGIKVGYCKPVGQKYVNTRNIKVDKDAYLFSDVMKFELDSDVHSPVILGKGATEKFLDHPEQYTHFHNNILKAKKALEDCYEMVIYEGTGHPGVGSVVGLSNGDVADLLQAGVIIVVEGGIGSTIDMLNLCLAEFERKDVPILGVIVNKVRPDKINKIKKYLKIWLDKKGLPLLGVMPYDKSLAWPLMSTITKAIRGKVLYNKHRLTNKIEDYLAGSLIGMERLNSSKDLLLVVSSQRVDTAVQKIKRMSDIMQLEESPLSGIILTGLADLKEETVLYIKKHQIPVVRSPLDTYGSVTQISRIEVKINLRTPWKIDKAIEMIKENIDFDLILKKV